MKSGAENQQKEDQNDDRSTREGVRVEFGGEVVDEFYRFEYIGSEICNDRDVRKGVRFRIVKTGTVLAKDNKV